MSEEIESMWPGDSPALAAFSVWIGQEDPARALASWAQRDDREVFRDMAAAVGVVLGTMDAEEKQALDADGNCSSSGRPRPQVIIVTGHDGRERRFAADRWNLEKDGLTVHRDHDVIARYQKHAWLSVREEGAIASDSPADKRKLDIATDALERLAGCDYNPDKDGEQAFEIAGDALDEIAKAHL